MRTIIIMSCFLLVLSWWSFLNSFFYAFYRKGCALVNRAITLKGSRLVFLLFKYYMNFKFAGEKNLFDQLPPQFVILSNHQSLLDIVAYMRFLGGTRVKFIAKYELGNHVPLVSVMLKSDHHCLVKRTGSPSQAMESIDKFANMIKETDFIPIIFPEGTRSRTGELGTFYSAGFRRFINKAPMPVAVCALDGAWKISSVLGLVKNLNGGHYRLKILKIYPAPSCKEDQVKILEEGKVLIQEQLKLWRGEKNEE